MLITVAGNGAEPNPETGEGITEEVVEVVMKVDSLVYMRVTRKARVRIEMKARSHNRLELPCFWMYGWRRMSFVLVLFVFFIVLFW